MRVKRVLPDTDARGQRTATIRMETTHIDEECISNGYGEAVGLLMTYRCNLDCRYCYIHRKKNKDMDLDTARSILEPFLQKDEGPLDITFMGGETLLAIDVIKPLVEWAEKGKWKRPFRFLGSTNGTLLDDGLRIWLKNHSRTVTLGLSYDGVPSAQKENRGSTAIDVDFFIRTWPRQPIQMTINAASVDRMADGVVYLLEKGAMVHPNVAFEDKEWTDDSIDEYGRQLDMLISYYNSHDNLPVISQFQHNLSVYADSIDNHKSQVRVCGAGDGFQVFDTDGESYPCHILSPLVLENGKLQSIREGLLSRTTDFADPRCENCPYTSSCPTCMACNYLYRDGFQFRDNTHCAIMRTEVKAFIKKEVLRLTAKETLTSEDATEIDSIKKLIDFEKQHSN